MKGKQFSSFPELKASGSFMGEGNDGGVPKDEENGGENTKYSTVSYNASKKDDPESMGNQKSFKTYYDKNRKPKIYEDLYSDYETEEKKPENATLETTARPRRKKKELYLPSQEYLAHLKNKENKIQRGSRGLFSKIFPKVIKPEDRREGEFSGEKTLDQMGFVINKKDLELQEAVYKEVEAWRNKLSETYGNKKKDDRNKRELEVFNKNPYEWTKIAISNQLNKLRNDLRATDDKNRKRFIGEKIADKEKTLNNIINAIQKEVPLHIDSDFKSDIITLGENELDTTIATDAINELVKQKNAHYTIAGVVMRNKNKFIVLKNEKGERVELLIEDAERLAKETSIEFIKEKEKESKLQEIQVNDIVKIRTGGLDGKRSSYKITGVEKGRIFFEDTATNQKGNMSIEDMRTFLMDKNKEFVVEKSEDYRNKEVLKSLEYFSKKIEELKIHQTIGKRGATPEEKIKIWKEELALLGFGNIQIELGEKIEDKEGVEKKELEEKRRKEIMKEIGYIFRKNNLKLDRVVIHGYSFENKEGELMSHWDVDSDTRGALYLLQLAGIRTNEIEKTHKGTEVEPKPGEVMMYIDTSGKTLSVERKNGGVQIIDDHHQRDYPAEKTSATKDLYKTLLENNLIKRQPWIDRLVDCIDQEDNLSYVDTKRFNKDYFKYKYASSLFALQKEVSFDDILRWCKEGRDLFDPKFTEEELKQDVKITIEVEGWEDKDGKKSKAYKEVVVPLAGVIAKIQANIDSDFKAFEFARRKMDERGIKKETKELGRVLYNIPDFQNFVGKNKGKVVNKFNYPFLITKAMGGDTYVSYSELTKKYFINSSTYDLTFIDKELLKRMPSSNMVNGVMILPPRTMAERRIINEEEFMKIIRLKE